MKYIKLFEDYLRGGKADYETVEDLAFIYHKKNGGDYKKILNNLEKNLEMGLKVESEHTDKPEVAHEIALDHLAENPNYYKLLKKAHLADELE